MVWEVGGSVVSAIGVLGLGRRVGFRRGWGLGLWSGSEWLMLDDVDLREGGGIREASVGWIGNGMRVYKYMGLRMFGLV